MKVALIGTFKSDNLKTKLYISLLMSAVLQTVCPLKQNILGLSDTITVYMPNSFTFVAQNFCNLTISPTRSCVIYELETAAWGTKAGKAAAGAAGRATDFGDRQVRQVRSERE